MTHEYGKSPHNGQWYCRLTPANGGIIAQGVGYVRRIAFGHVIRLLKSSTDAPVVNLFEPNS
jgi:uncharacterized protein YegP (UPF0339 family)